MANVRTYDEFRNVVFSGTDRLVKAVDQFVVGVTESGQKLVDYPGVTVDTCFATSTPFFTSVEYGDWQDTRRLPMNQIEHRVSIVQLAAKGTIGGGIYVSYRPADYLLSYPSTAYRVSYGYRAIASKSVITVFVDA